jgi:glycosyltransferase involved in cell wall biosynthesis
VRVVIVDPRGDSRPYDHGLGAALVQRGHAVVLATSRFHHGDLPPAPGVRVQERFYVVADRLPRPLRRFARGVEHPVDLLLLVLSLAIRRPDAIHVQWLPLGRLDRLAWRLARRVVRRPLVYTAHNAAPKHGVGSAAQVRADCGPFDRVIVHSAFGQASLETLGVPTDRVRRVIHGALDGYARLEAVLPARVPKGVPVAAFVGLIRPYKGLDLLLAAWPAVREQVPEAVLLVHGRSLGGDADAARALAMADQGVVAEIRYASAGEFAGDLRRADVVVLPYRSIDQSGVLFTALALGRPVIATDVGGLGEVLGPTGAGVLVPPADPATLAAALAALLLDPARRAAMGEAARAAAAGEWSWGRAAAATEAIYRGG